MTRKDILNRLNNLYQQLEVMNRYPESFLNALGKKGLQNKVDEILDEINFLRGLLKEMGE